MLEFRKNSFFVFFSPRVFCLFSYRKNLNCLYMFFMIFNLMKLNHATFKRWNISASNIITDLSRFCFSFDYFYMRYRKDSDWHQNQIRVRGEVISVESYFWHVHQTSSLKTLLKLRFWRDFLDFFDAKLLHFQWRLVDTFQANYVVTHFTF